MKHRNSKKIKEGHDTACKEFAKIIQQCKDEDILAGFIQTTCTLTCKLMHGMEGKEFKDGFLASAINDNEPIEPVRIH